MQEMWLIPQWEHMTARDVNTKAVLLFCFVKIICDFIDIKIW